MHKFLESTKAKALTAMGVLASPVLLFAEGNTPENPLASVQETAIQYITIGKGTVVAILGAGLVIVAAFYVWHLIKKGLGSAK